ncbi:MAG: hypothetical protein K0R75_1750 [Paenibacillaceae bacterium]|jgi:hypothetical protein|nr:hypothetical protein [Paenibacillaceae bacterium]
MKSLKAFLFGLLFAFLAIGVLPFLLVFNFSDDAGITKDSFFAEKFFSEKHKDS